MMLAAIWGIERCPSPLTTPRWMDDVIHLKATECIYQPALGLAYKWRFTDFIWRILQFTKRCPQNTGFRHITRIQSTGTVKHPHNQTQTTAAFRGTSAHRFAPSHPNSQERNAESCRSSANSQELIHCIFTCGNLYLQLSAASPVFLDGSGSSRERKPMNSDHNTILLPSQFQQPKGLWSCPCNYDLINNFIWNHHDVFNCPPH